MEEKGAVRYSTVLYLFRPIASPSLEIGTCCVGRWGRPMIVMEFVIGEMVLDEEWNWELGMGMGIGNGNGNEREDRI